MKKILILMPKNLKKGQPSSQRINSFVGFYKSQNIDVILYDMPIGFKDRINLIIYIYKNSIRNVFISMPPFRNWYLFLLPKIHIVLDIRDGWSIAIRTGYGGTVPSRKTKALVCQLIENCAIKRSILTITCTTGLQKYLQSISLKEILLITNGVSIEDFNMTRMMKKSRNDNSTQIAVCVGQFSEYGKEKIITILQKINALDIKTIIKLIGASIDKNRWIYEWLKEKNLTNVKIDMVQWMERSDMYQEIINADYGICVIRDPAYDFGTKVFDYIVCGIPVFNYFDGANEFSEYFRDFLTDSKVRKNQPDVFFVRDRLLKKQKKNLIDALE